MSDELGRWDDARRFHLLWAEASPVVRAWCAHFRSGGVPSPRRTLDELAGELLAWQAPALQPPSDDDGIGEWKVAHWLTMTTPAIADRPRTGTYSDGDLRARLHSLVDMLIKGEAAAREAQRLLDADIAGAKENGQAAIADEFIQDLVARRSR
jgi:hypothetical protein